MERLDTHWMDFHEIWYLSIFQTFIERIQDSLKSDKNKGYFCMKTNINFWSYIIQFFLKWEMLETEVVEKLETDILLFSVTFSFFEICAVLRYCGKILQSRAGHRWQYGADALHAGYIRLQTRRLCRTFCSSTASTNTRQCYVIRIFFVFNQYIWPIRCNVSVCVCCLNP